MQASERASERASKGNEEQERVQFSLYTFCANKVVVVNVCVVGKLVKA